MAMGKCMKKKMQEKQRFLLKGFNVVFIHLWGLFQSLLKSYNYIQVFQK